MGTRIIDCGRKDFPLLEKQIPLTCFFLMFLLLFLLCVLCTVLQFCCDPNNWHQHTHKKKQFMNKSENRFGIRHTNRRQLCALVFLVCILKWIGIDWINLWPLITYTQSIFIKGFINKIRNPPKNWFSNYFENEFVWLQNVMYECKYASGDSFVGAIIF